jgi:ABC-type multidrug transport system ATPase subunit
VFRQLNLVVQPNEILRIGGRNGSGKSTLLRVLGGEEYLTEGELVFTKAGGAVYLDQFAGQLLAADLTIRDHLILAGSDSRDELLNAINSLAEYALGLERRLDDFVGHLSGGQKQIVALTCILLSHAQLICLDEFTSALDVQARAQALDTVLRQAQNKASVVFVSHDPYTDIAVREIRMDWDTSAIGAES